MTLDKAEYTAQQIANARHVIMVVYTSDRTGDAIVKHVHERAPDGRDWHAHARYVPEN